jgi:hypothetical protein
MHVKPPFRRKSTLRRVVDSVSDQLGDAVNSGKAAKTGLITAGSVAGLTAGSAAISSLRHRMDRERDDS